MRKKMAVKIRVAAKDHVWVHGPTTVKVWTPKGHLEPGVWDTTCGLEGVWRLHCCQSYPDMSAWGFHLGP